MNTEQLRKEINKTNASLFRVSFVKANGEHRTMYAKVGIKRHLSKKLRAIQLFMRVSVQEPTLHESLILAQDERWRRA